MWIATIILAFVGLFFGGPFGAIFGALIGLYIDGQKRPKVVPGAGRRNPFQQGPQRAEAQSAFFEATFVVMGRLAKADGRVTEDEIRLATALMNEMRLSTAMRQQAIEFFNQGKDGRADIVQVLAKFRRVAESPALIQMFLELQLQAAYVDGDLTQAELGILQQACDILGVSAFTFQLLRSRFEAQRAFFQHARGHAGGQQHYQPRQSADELRHAYAVLGVEPSADDATIKRAYRKLMSQHHPDKLVAKGLPEEMMEVAKQKTQEIQAAYDLIRKHRKS